MEDLEEFEVATKLLQDSQRTLLEVRFIFDGLLHKYPDMQHYLASDSSFVHSPAFENGIVKVFSDECDELLSKEKLQLTPFLSSNVPNLVSPTKPRSVALQALNNVKRRTVELQYVSLRHIPPTSNMVGKTL